MFSFKEKYTIKLPTMPGTRLSAPFALCLCLLWLAASTDSRPLHSSRDLIWEPMALANGSRNPNGTAETIELRWRKARADFHLGDAFFASLPVENKSDDLPMLPGILKLPVELRTMVDDWRRFSNAEEKESHHLHLPILLALIDDVRPSLIARYLRVWAASLADTMTLNASKAELHDIRKEMLIACLDAWRMNNTLCCDRYNTVFQRSSAEGLVVPGYALPMTDKFFVLHYAQDARAYFFALAGAQRSARELIVDILKDFFRPRYLDQHESPEYLTMRRALCTHDANAFEMHLRQHGSKIPHETLQQLLTMAEKSLLRFQMLESPTLHLHRIVLMLRVQLKQ